MDKQLEKEKQRKLSPAEERRLERFNTVCAELESEGYARHDLTVGIVKANIFAFVLAIPVFVIGFGAFSAVNHGIEFNTSLTGLIVSLIALVVLTVVHELIHGLTWGVFATNGMKDIEFGFMKEYLTPYCTCSAPLPKRPYILGGLMPGIVLGLIPTIVAIFINSYALLLIGMVMILGAAGDILIVIELLRYRSNAAEKLIYDHPTQAGCVVFER